jgi:hypothetical protein
MVADPEFIEYRGCGDLIGRRLLQPTHGGSAEIIGKHLFPP